MSWVEVDGGGWRLVEVDARFSNTQKERLLQTFNFESFYKNIKFEIYTK